MNETEKLSGELHDIKDMMERSSRFISLSGLSGIAAGLCALTGAWFANEIIQRKKDASIFLHDAAVSSDFSISEILKSTLFQVAVITFISALITAFIFTYLRSKKNNIPVWGFAARRLLINVMVPLVAGAFFLIKLLQHGSYGLIAPGCLIFYGIAVFNASNYTLPETRFLGYGEILLGLTNLFFISYGLYFWATGFGVLHIIYGIYMWGKYERS